MKKLIKAALIIAAIFVLVFTASIIYIYKKYPPEKIKSILLENVSKNINRKVEVGEIEAGLFKGISISDINIYERDGKNKFITLKKISLTPSILSILTGKLYISKVVILEPHINIVYRKNQFNFSDLIKPQEKGGSPELPLYINKVAVQSGSFTVDYEGRIIKIKNLNLTSKAINLKGGFPLDFDLMVDTPPVEKIELNGKTMVSTKFIELKTLRITKDKALVAVSGFLKPDSVNLKGNVKNLSSESFVKAPLNLTLDSSFEVVASTTRIENFVIKSVLGVSGKLENITVSGNGRIDVNLNGDLKSILARADSDFSNIEIKSTNFNKKKGDRVKFHIESKILEFKNLKLVINSDILGIESKASGSVVIDKRSLIDIALNAKKFSLSTIKGFLPFDVEGTVNTVEGNIKGVIPLVAYNFKTRAQDIKLKLENIKIEKTKLDLNASNDEIKLDADGLFNEGGFALKLKAKNFLAPDMDINAKFDSFNLDPFIVINPQATTTAKKDEVIEKPQFTSTGEVVFKRITQKLYEGNNATMKWSFKGRGNNIKALSGSFSFNMGNGTIKTGELTKNLKKIYDPEKPDLNYRSLSVNGEISDAVVKLKGVINGEDDVDIYLTGNYGMENKTLDFDIKLEMPGERVPQSLRAYMKDEKKLELELKLAGTIDAPKYTIKSKMVERVVEKKIEEKKEELKKEAEKKIKEIFKLGD